MTLRMEPGQTYNSWTELKEALDVHCKENKVIFNIANAKTVESANASMKKGPYYDTRLKSYKINCRAFISISACRKENYLIIRDSYHKHSHPCTEEIYNSYPEVRRMTRDERRMVGQLLDLGVPISQIRTAVGRNVTPKDLHNAKSHIKAVKMGLKNDEAKTTAKYRRTNKEMETARQGVKITADETVTDSEEETNTEEIPAGEEFETQNDLKISSQASPFMNDAEESVQDVDSKDVREKGSHESSSFFNPENPSSVIVGAVNDEREGEAGEMNGVSGLLAAAGSVDAQESAPDEDGIVGARTSYTVVVSSDGSMEMAQSGSNLQDLLKRVETERILKPKTKSSEGKSDNESTEVSPKVDHKNCENCEKYMSPLDGHSLCIACLGPQHLHVQGCEHCATMKPEQLNIRRKVFVRMRMKALKEMNDTKRLNQLGESMSPQSLNSDSQIFQARKSKRVRKPKDFGPEMDVQTLLGHHLATSKFPGGSKAKVTKCVVNDGEKEYVVEIPKREPDDDYACSLGDSVALTKPLSQNTLRFDHLLRQTSVLEDISLVQCSNGTLGYMPDSVISNELSNIELQSNVSSVPTGVEGKYSLDDQFESAYCSIPAPLESLGDPTITSMGDGLHKLAQNAAVQTRLAVYDKLFTKLGVGMADEALGILGQLCGKVTQVTEISQEDLTNDLQTAQDTILALKDVLEELSIMSKDALSTAAHQRNISLNSLEKAKSSLSRSLTSPDIHQTQTKRRKFQPFSRSKTLNNLNTPTMDPEPALVGVVKSDNSEGIKVENFSSHTPNTVVMNVSSLPSTLNTPSMTPVLAVGTSHSELTSVGDVSATFIDVSNKHYTIAPNMSLSGELLETLQNQKDGIIELHVVKDEDDIVANQGASIVHEVIQTPPIEVGVVENSNMECE